MCLSVVELVNSMVINLLMDETSECSKSVADGPMAWSNGAIFAVIWLTALFFEVFQVLGYWSNKSIWRYFSSPRQRFEWLVFSMTGVFIIVLLTPGMNSSYEDGVFSACSGIWLSLK